ncbi:hypothetical protein MUN77_03580 [Leucobacter allii]|nr:hypothetical protein [Leucobacter allii]UOR03478.1 hypothetical protein MUN77_03580 [Leucobacter allii]
MNATGNCWHSGESRGSVGREASRTFIARNRYRKDFMIENRKQPLRRVLPEHPSDAVLREDFGDDVPALTG